MQSHIWVVEFREYGLGDWFFVRAFAKRAEARRYASRFTRASRIRKYIRQEAS